MTYFVMMVLSGAAVFAGLLAFQMEGVKTLGGLLMLFAGLACAAYATLWINWLRMTPQERAERDLERQVRKVDAQRREYRRRKARHARRIVFARKHYELHEQRRRRRRGRGNG